MKRFLVGITAVLAAVITVAVITAAGFGPLNHVDNKFESRLSGAQVVTDTGSAMGGKFGIKFKRNLSEAGWILAVNNNINTITAAHIHCGEAGVNGGVVFPLFSGSFTAPSGMVANGIVRNSDFSTPASCGSHTNINNVASFMATMMDDVFYVNVHTGVFPGGEVRGQLWGH